MARFEVLKADVRHGVFPTETVTVEVTTKVYARKGDSGAYVYFHFCPECESTISPTPLSRHRASPSSCHIGTPWVSVPEGIPQNEGHSAALCSLCSRCGCCGGTPDLTKTMAASPVPDWPLPEGLKVRKRQRECAVPQELRLRWINVHALDVDGLSTEFSDALAAFPSSWVEAGPNPALVGTCQV